MPIGFQDAVQRRHVSGASIDTGGHEMMMVVEMMWRLGYMNSFGLDVSACS